LPELILASTSPYREKVLRRLSLPFRAIAPDVEESVWKEAIAAPDELAVALAQAKARCVAQQVPEAVVIGSDQVAALGSELLHKPGSREATIQQLEQLSGKTHDLITAVCVSYGAEERILLARTSLTMRRLSREDIEVYVDLDRAFDCAGGYKFEEHGISLFDEVRCTDATAIEGLPLISVARALREFGFHFPQRDAT
jgi:septum formation protein